MLHIIPINYSNQNSSLKGNNKLNNTTENYWAFTILTIDSAILILRFTFYAIHFNLYKLWNSALDFQNSYAAALLFILLLNEHEGWLIMIGSNLIFYEFWVHQAKFTMKLLLSDTDYIILCVT